jgi:3-oxoacyl-[acyl-carrier protein] reductase
MPAAVVTGSSSGIGLAVAALLAKQGYSVILHGSCNLSGLQNAAREIRSSLSAGQSVRCVTADISDQHACRQLVDTCFGWHPQIALWVNNAGADVLTDSLRDSDFETKLNRLWQVDVLGTIRLSRHVAQRMTERMTQWQTDQTALDSNAAVLPAIINVGWDQAFLGMEGDPGQLFCPIKAAVTAFTSALALTLAPRIRVNTVAPGWIQTAWGRDSASDYWQRRATQESLLERWGSPQDVAEAICWLASPSARFVNGQTLYVNGGRRFTTIAAAGD